MYVWELGVGRCTGTCSHDHHCACVWGGQRPQVLSQLFPKMDLSRNLEFTDRCTDHWGYKCTLLNFFFSWMLSWEVLGCLVHLPSLEQGCCSLSGLSSLWVAGSRCLGNSLVGSAWGYPNLKEILTQDVISVLSSVFFLTDNPHGFPRLVFRLSNHKTPHIFSVLTSQFD